MSIQKIMDRYDGDHDLIPGGPVVTWAEYDLAVTIDKLISRIGDLERKVEALQSIANPGAWKEER
jgi:hypothetical protein